MTGPSARRVPSQARSRATVEAVVEAAAQVFERHGYGAGTTNRIAERAGVSIGSVYQYFDDKDAIVEAVALRHLADGAERLLPVLARLDGDLADVEPEVVLREVLVAMLDLHRDRPRLHRLLFEETPLTEAVRARGQALEDAAARMVATWLGRRPDPPQHPALTARLLVEAVESWSHRVVLHPPPDADEPAFVTAATRILAAGL